MIFADVSKVIILKRILTDFPLFHMVGTVILLLDCQCSGWHFVPERPDIILYHIGILHFVKVFFVF